MKTLYLSDYIVTEKGDVINKRSGRKIKPQPNGKGYLRVSIAGKLQFVHRLVAEKYVPNPEGKPQVNHKDGNKLNNFATNLEWVTNSENRKHAVKNLLHLTGEKCPWSKLTQKEVDSIRLDKTLTQKELAKKYGVAVSTIAAVKQGKSWKNS